jgi:hypothetical protein
MCGIAGALVSLFLAPAPFSTATYRHLGSRLADLRLVDLGLTDVISGVHNWGDVLSHWWTPLPEEVSKSIQQLDDESFDIRQAAATRLRELSRDSVYAAALTAYFERLLGDEQLSAEVRSRLEALLRNLPRPLPLYLSPAQVDRLLTRLDSDSFGVRAAAIAQLDRMGRDPATISLLLEVIKTRLADPKLSISLRGKIEPLWDRVHGAWLLEDQSEWKLPPVPPERIHAWIETLTRDPPESHEGQWLPHQVATRELLDLLARPDTCPATTKELADRLSVASLDPAVALRLQAIYDRSRHAVVSEFWQYGRRRMTQYFYLPDPPHGAHSSRDFDHANDCVLHCLTDNILPGGDYVLGEAMSGGDPECFWYSVNLPTAKRRLAYEFILRSRSDSQRLVDITAETLQRYVDFGRPLTDFLLLDQLDASTISRFAGSYLAAANDGEGRPIPREWASGDPSLFGSPSRLGRFCLWLGDRGTRYAIPGLMDAIAQERIYKPDKDCSLNLPWIAALMIAQRDPDPDQDSWLAHQIARTELLDRDSAELGATAAAILLRRHHERLDEFGLEESDSAAIERLNLRGYRFHDQEHRISTLRWWSEQSARSRVAHD